MVSGTTTVGISVTDDIGVSKVELYIEGTRYAEITAAPFDFVWDTTKYPDGTYSLEARAYDSSENMGKSEDVVVSVSNPVDTTAPLLSILYPIRITLGIPGKVKRLRSAGCVQSSINK